MNTRTPIRIVTLLALLALALAACTTGGTTAPAAAPSDTAAAPTDAAVSGPVLGTIEIQGFDIGYQPTSLQVDKPGRYTVTFINNGAQDHDWIVPGLRLLAKGGETATGDIMVPEKGLRYTCSFAGHAAAGMRGTISIKGGEAAAMEDHSAPAPARVIKPDENAPKYEVHNPAAPTALEGTTHDIDLVTEEKLMTVADGYVQKVWTFNGTVPGPVIRVKVGDTVRIHLKNPATSQMSHSVDFHASQVAMNDEMRSIKPGEELLYEYKAEYAGVWMYHCGTPPTLHHIMNGMFGMVIVEPKEGLPKVDKEFAFVQSEWYLGPQGEVTDLEKASLGSPSPDFVVFNGVANQYKDNPVEIGTGERVRVFVLNAGPSVDSSFHIVGTIFDTVIKEGVQLTRNNPGNYGSQAVDLAPAQGAIIEFQTAEDGMYAMVTHAFNFVGRGALGLFKSGDGDPKN